MPLPLNQAMQICVVIRQKSVKIFLQADGSCCKRIYCNFSCCQAKFKDFLKSKAWDFWLTFFK